MQQQPYNNQQQNYNPQYQQNQQYPNQYSKSTLLPPNQAPVPDWMNTPMSASAKAKPKSTGGFIWYLIFGLVVFVLTWFIKDKKHEEEILELKKSPSTPEKDAEKSIFANKIMPQQRANVSVIETIDDDDYDDDFVEDEEDDDEEDDGYDDEEDEDEDEDEDEEDEEYDDEEEAENQANAQDSQKEYVNYSTDPRFSSALTAEQLFEKNNRTTI